MRRVVVAAISTTILKDAAKRFPKTGQRSTKSILSIKEQIAELDKKINKAKVASDDRLKRSLYNQKCILQGKLDLEENKTVR